MRAQILHDRDGTICGALIPEEGNRAGGLVSRGPEQTVIEVDAPEPPADHRSEHGDHASATLAHLVENYRVDSGRLVARSSDNS